MGRRGPRHGGGPGGGGYRTGGASIAAPAPQPLPPTEEHPPVKGPHPGMVSVACQYTQEQQLRRMQRDNGCDPSREDSYRLQGVQLIDNVRESLQLPVKTFATACTYYHKFRLNFRDAEYNFQDAALSALFVACKVEDTIKKSRDVLCAAYNLKNPDKPTTPDDKIFERPSTIIVGLDRLILQTVGFDFRVRYPQKLLAKLVRQLIPPEDAKDFLAVAYPMSIDLYKTFAPIKQTSFTMALSAMELTALVTDKHVDTIKALDLGAYHTSRGSVTETLLDLLDLYTQFTKCTKIGTRFPLNKFIDIKIKVNQEVDDDASLARVDSWCDKCAFEDKETSQITPGSATSPATTSSWPGGGSLAKATSSKARQEGTLRFVFEAEKMRQEQAEVEEYYKEEYEEYEVEVDEMIPETHGNNRNSHMNNHGGRNRPQRERHFHNNRNSGNNGNSGGNNGSNNSGNNSRNSNNNNNESGWGPYQRSRNHEHHRPKPRKGGYY